MGLVLTLVRSTCLYLKATIRMKAILTLTNPSLHLYPSFEQTHFNHASTSKCYLGLDSTQCSSNLPFGPSRWIKKKNWLKRLLWPIIQLRSSQGNTPSLYIKTTTQTKTRRMKTPISLFRKDGGELEVNVLCTCYVLTIFTTFAWLPSSPK